MAARDEGPADLDLAEHRIITEIAAGSDQPATRPIDKDKGHFGIDGAVEEFAKFSLGVTIGNRMHFPDLGIGAGGEQFGPIVRRDRSDDDVGTGQGRLKVGLGHRASVTQSPD
jgi:hypothetical protein